MLAKNFYYCMLKIQLSIKILFRLINSAAELLILGFNLFSNQNHVTKLFDNSGFTQPQRPAKSKIFNRNPTRTKKLITENRPEQKN